MEFPAHILAKIPLIKLLVSKEEDNTIANKMYEYVLICFGVFTLISGLCMLELLPRPFIKFFERPNLDSIVFAALGIILTTFYCLVLYTNIPIPKKHTNYKHYLLFGLGSGILFLLMPIIVIFIKYFIPYFNTLSLEAQSMCIITLSVILAVIGDVLYAYKKLYDIKPQDVVPQQLQVITNNLKNDL